MMTPITIKQPKVGDLIRIKWEGLGETCKLEGIYLGETQSSDHQFCHQITFDSSLSSFERNQTVSVLTCWIIHTHMGPINHPLSHVEEVEILRRMG